MNYYFLHGKLTATQGHRDELADILIYASSLVAKAKGCHLYAIGLDASDTNSVYVTEIWESKEDHDESLKAEDVKDCIMKAIPLVAEAPSRGQELTIIGGFGI